ncbi:serine protease [Streptomyces sp. NPDC006393]|uniref:serine protease n=1 Tax=Streptomyces sp. NPDC006393 TaxID=3156763 RepID=UPI0033EA5D43
MTERHVVRILAASNFRGTGFLVSPDTVLTCAHVVSGCEGVPLSVEAEGSSLAAEVVRMEPRVGGAGIIHEYPDLAELRLSEPAAGLAGVWLDEAAPAQSEPVSVHGFSGHTLDPGVQPDTLDLRVAGRSGRFVRLQGDQVVRGFSGGPVLNLRTGRVCGILKASRNEKDVSGGWLIPVAAVESCSPGLVQRNAWAHGPGTEWFDTARGRQGFQDTLFAEGRGSGGQRTTPAQMLARGAMPFVPRPELAELHTWCQEPADQLLRLLHAPGGSGKTRLAAELCGQLRQSGWIAGFAEPEPFKDSVGRSRWLEELSSALAAGFPTLVVFDYAQARQDDVCALLSHVHRRRRNGMTLRVLLLARSEDPLWPALREALEDLEVEDWALAGASSRRLPSTIEAADPETLAEQAFSEFARQLDCSWLPVPQSLGRRARRQDSLLGVLASALDAVLSLKQGETWDEGDDPLVRICRHETRAWHAFVEDQLGESPALNGRVGPVVTQALLLVPTLARGLVPDRLTALLARTHEAAFPGRPSLDMSAVHACLRALYPAPGGAVAPLEPDRVGEILVRRVLRETDRWGRSGEAYLAAVLDVADAPDASADERVGAVLPTLDALARARGCTAVGRVVDHPAHAILDRSLRLAVRTRPRLLVPALIITGSRMPHADPLAEVMRPALESCDTELLRQAEQFLPSHPSGLSGIAALVLGRLLRPAEEGDGDEEGLLRLRRLVRFSLRLDETGHRGDAIKAADRAVVLSRELLRRSERHAPEHATALHNLAALQHRAGRTSTALGLSIEALTLYRQLLDAPGAHRRRRLLDTAAVLSTLALLRLFDGQVNGAAGDASEGVIRCEQAGAGPRQEDILLSCLEILAECRHRTGLTTEALATGAQAVRLARDLAERRPGQHLARLPGTLQRQGLGLIRAGRLHEAYVVLREAVQLRAALPLHLPAHRQDQRVALRVLLQLEEEMDGSTQERPSWRLMLSGLDGHDALQESHADE